MSTIELIVDGESVFSQLGPPSCGSEVAPEPSHVSPTLAHDTVVQAQVRKSDTGVYFQAKFHDGSRQSVYLENVNINGLEDTFDETNKSTRLSFAGSGNHFYTPANVVEGIHVYADNIHIGDLPEGWDDNRK